MLGIVLGGCGGRLEDGLVGDASTRDVSIRRADAGTDAGAADTAGESDACEASPACMADASLPSKGCYQVGDLTCFQPPPFVPPRPPSADCTATQIQGLWDACLSNVSTTTCLPWLKANPACADCIFTPSTAKTWGAMVDYPTWGALDLAGCVALRGDLSCARAIEARDACIDASCGSSGWQCGAQEDKWTDFSRCVEYETVCGCAAYVKDVDNVCSKTMGSAYDTCALTTFENDYFRYATMFCSAD